MEQKYALDYENLGVLFYRGNDKRMETIERPTNTLPPYSEHVKKGKELLQKNPSLRFIIQSDETEYIREMLAHFPNSIVFHDEIRHNNQDRSSSVDRISHHGGKWDTSVGKSNYDFAFYFMAIILIMSKSKHLVMNIGNCSVWICFFREHVNNVHLYVNNEWN